MLNVDILTFIGDFIEVESQPKSSSTFFILAGVCKMFRSIYLPLAVKKIELEIYKQQSRSYSAQKFLEVFDNSRFFDVFGNSRLIVDYIREMTIGNNKNINITMKILQTVTNLRSLKLTRTDITYWKEISNGLVSIRDLK